MKNRKTTLHLLAFKQEGMQMYTGVMTAEQIFECTDSANESGTPDSTGFPLEAGNSRAMAFARYLKENPKPLVQTALLFGYRRAFGMEVGSDGRVTVEIPAGETLRVIDGKHRIRGFRIAIDDFRIERLRTYCVPVVIAEKLDEIDAQYLSMMFHETSVRWRSSLDRNLQDQHMFREQCAGGKFPEGIRSDWATKAAAITKALNTNKQSPWYGSIQMADENKKDKHVVKEFTVKQSLKDLGVNKAFKKNSSQEVTQILMEYWLAWKDLAPDGFKYPDKYMLMKSAGLNICHMLLVVILKETSQSVMLAMKAKDFKILLKQLAEPPAPINYRRASAGGVEDEEEEELDDTDFLSAQFWRSDSFRGAAVVGSSKGHKLIRDAMAARLFPPDKEV